jgi:hypothetical protein
LLEAEKAWRAKNPDKVALYRQRQRAKLVSPERAAEMAAYHKDYRAKNQESLTASRSAKRRGSEAIREYNRRRYQLTKDARNARQRELYSSCNETKASMLLRSRLTAAIRGEYKSGSAVADLGCTIKELVAHLEGQFLPGMTWKNWSRHGWHIDHIEPLCSFDLTDRAQVLRACHYTNLRPMWAIENLRKGAVDKKSRRVKT